MRSETSALGVQQEISKALQTRYACKEFDSTKNIDTKDLDLITESLRLAPSSFGIEWRGFVIVQNKELRETMLPACYGQKQIVDASQVIVLCRSIRTSTELIQNTINNISKTRGVPVANLEWYANMMTGTLSNKSEQEMNAWLDKQVYIALGCAIMTCALLDIDSCPMEWFNPAQVDEILWLTAQWLASVALLPIGYRSSNDKDASMPKVRAPKEKVIFYK